MIKFFHNKELLLLCPSNSVGTYASLCRMKRWRCEEHGNCYVQFSGGAWMSCGDDDHLFDNVVYVDTRGAFCLPTRLCVYVGELCRE